MPTILLTGGTGYIGSHTCVELIESGFDTILLDNLCNSSPVVIDRIAAITGKRPAFIEGDVRDRTLLERDLLRAHVAAVVHFAGLKAVGDSVAHPLDYYSRQRRGLDHAIRGHAGARRSPDRVQLVSHGLRHGHRDSVDRAVAAPHP